MNLTRHHGYVGVEDRQQLMCQRPLTIWLTGLSGAGKSTLAFMLEKALIDKGRVAFVLDGDNVRHGLNRDLGFSSEDRSENIRRIAEIARLMNEAGLIVVTAFISPYKSDRELARKIVGNGHFLEVFVSTPLSVCEARDPKQLYAKARAGQINEFTGISSPYEVPDCAEIELDTSVLTEEQCLETLLGGVMSRIQF